MILPHTRVDKGGGGARAVCVTHIYTHIAICRKEGVSLQNEEEGENAL